MLTPTVVRSAREVSSLVRFVGRRSRGWYVAQCARDAWHIGAEFSGAHLSAQQEPAETLSAEAAAAVRLRALIAGKPVDGA
jgi:hypothetical protein